MDVISSVRQMMAESQFFEAQRLIETHFLSKDEVLIKELSPLYLEILLAQNKQPPVLLVFEIAERYLDLDIDKAETILNLLSQNDSNRFFLKKSKIKLRIAEKKGKIEELYSSIFSIQIFLFSNRIPSLELELRNLINKYFPKDFGLSLQRLSLEIMNNDYSAAELRLKKLILSCYEQSAPKAINDKLNSIEQILKTCKTSCSLDIYKGLCSLLVNKIQNKLDYKRLAECVIYFDEFKFQTILLNLLSQLEFNEMVQSYAKTLKSNPDYDFVYFDKFFPHLKILFVSQEIEKKKESPGSLLTEADLKLDKSKIKLERETQIQDEIVNEEAHFITLLTYQEHSLRDLLEIATSFLQARMPSVALKATNLALNLSQNDQSFLKIAYLKIMSLMQLMDYRAALDLSIEAVSLSNSEEDKLSFLYIQSDIYLKLNELKTAKNILRRIHSVDENYRLTRERLQKLNEI